MWHAKSRKGLTVRIKVRSIRFFMTAYKSSGETSPFPTVMPSSNSLFHSSSGAVAMSSSIIEAPKKEWTEKHYLLIEPKTCIEPASSTATVYFTRFL